MGGLIAVSRVLIIKPFRSKNRVFFAYVAMCIITSICSINELAVATV